jgi:hypothetical protein
VELIQWEARTLSSGEMAISGALWTGVSPVSLALTPIVPRGANDDAERKGQAKDNGARDTRLNEIRKEPSGGETTDCAGGEAPGKDRVDDAAGDFDDLKHDCSGEPLWRYDAGGCRRLTQESNREHA